jgi:hypothetical protein
MQYSNHSSKVYLFGNSCIIDFVVIEKNLDSGRILKERPPGCRKLHEDNNMCELQEANVLKDKRLVGTKES